MARTEKNNVEYFPFICEEGNKMYYLEDKYGNDGFAVFVKLLRELAKANYHYLDLSKKSTLMFLSAKCKVDLDTLTSIINDLADLEKFDSELWNENSIIWCQDFIDNIQAAYKRRSNNCVDRNSLCIRLNEKGIHQSSKCIHKPNLCTPNVDVNAHSIVEYSKEENKRVENKEKIKPLKVFKDDIHFLYDSILPLFPTATQPKNQKEVDSWKDELRKLIEIDGYDVVTIENVVRSVRSDSFWSKNFLTLKKLRQSDKEGIKYIIKFAEQFKQKNCPNQMSDEYVYFRWSKGDPSNFARRILKAGADKYFEGTEAATGQTPKILKNITNKKTTWK